MEINFADKGSFGGWIILFIVILTIILGIIILIIKIRESGIMKNIYLKSFLAGIIFGISIEIGKGIYLGLIN